MSNEIEKKKQAGDEQQNAVSEFNTHPSNRAPVTAETGTVDTMEVASGLKVDMYPVLGSFTTTDTSINTNSDCRTTRDSSCLYHSHGLTHGPRRPSMTCS